MVVYLGTSSFVVALSVSVASLMELVTLYVTGIIVIFLCCTAATIIGSITIYQLHCKSVSTSHHSKLLIVITMVAYIVCSMGDMIQMILRFRNKSLLESDRLTEFELYLVTGKGALYYLGNATFFMLLLMRIRKSFQVSRCAMG